MNMKGFTLIEMMVTVGIMAVITTITLANHSRFGGQMMLRSLAYEIALVVREAQTYGVSVRRASTATGFDTGYGIHFDPSTPSSYIMFSDVDGDGLYTAGDDILVAEYNIGRGNQINRLCVTVGPHTSCNQKVDILFMRPEPDALIRFNGIFNNLYEKVEIELISPRGDTISVIVEVSGQISVIKMP